MLIWKLIQQSPERPSVAVEDRTVLGRPESPALIGECLLRHNLIGRQHERRGDRQFHE
jgi:hypothetical protein